MNTEYKYIKVSVSDRLPDKSGIYTIEFKNQLIRSWYNGLNFFRNGEIVTAEYWLHEVPDYEDEMKEMINELISELDPATLSGNYQEAIDKAKSLLSKLK